MNARLAPEPPAPFAPGVALPLPPGTRLRGWQIEAVVGQGGFGIVYRAREAATGRLGAIKEYLPAQLALRREDGSLGPVSPAGAETYAAGLRGFLDEAALLARLHHPALVEVTEAWEALGTAYMAMPFYEGPTLERVIAAHPEGLDEIALRAIAGPLLGALAAIHAVGAVHRDVSPDNVILRPDAGAVLLDLGAARRAIGERVRATTVMLKAGYAPIEQYADDPDCPVGPWSDVYALGAVLHHAACAQAPPPSPMRVMRDTRVPLAQRGLAGIGIAFAHAIDAAMALRPEERPPSASAFRERLGLPADRDEGITPWLGASGEAPGPGERRRGERRAVDRRRIRRAALLGGALAATLTVFLLSVGAWLTAQPPADPADLPVDDRVAIPEPTVDVVPAEVDTVLAPKPEPPKPALLKLAVSPWAEVWVDGTKRAVTPPVMTLPLAPGARRIELRNPGGETVVRRLDARPGQTLELSHRFATSPQTR